MPLTTSITASVTGPLRRTTTALAAGTALAVGLALAPATAAPVQPRVDNPPKVPSATGRGGSAASVDPNVTEIGLNVLRRGGNATDAAIAMAGALGVTEPYSSGIGGGGYFVHYDGRTHRVSTIDGRETAPATMPHDAFVDPDTGKPYNFTPELVTSGVSVGTPGSLATWQRALQRWGTDSLAEALRPGTVLASRGFVVDDTFRQQTLDNQQRFEAFPATARLFLPGGDAPKVGSVFRNPDLAATYRLIARDGTKAFYQGQLARQIASVVQHPRTSRTTDLPVPPGYLTAKDLAGYRTVDRRPTHVDYRGYDVYGMAPSSSGGTTVGEALNIMENFGLGVMSAPDALHHYLEATALAFADRGAYVGDPAYVDVPQRDLLSQKYANERACLIDPTTAFSTPVAAGDVDRYDGRCAGSASAASTTRPDTENVETTNLTTSDRWGNVVEYTLTIEQTGGSGQVVPGRGFLLNNELTDFTAAYDPADPNRIEAGKRPRSSISPTILLRDGEPFLALGSPGGSTIITTVLQIIFNRIDRQLDIQDALAAPRASLRNTPTVTAEPAFIDEYGRALSRYGYTLTPSGDAFTSAAEIGAATAVEFKPDGLLTAVAEPVRRGGGSAGVVRPSRD